MRSLLAVALLFSVSSVQAAESTPVDTGNSAGDSKEVRYKNLELFQKVLNFVETNYVDSVSNTELIQGAIKGMLASLDPHSAFLAADIFRDMKVDTTGRFGGVGLETTIRDNVLTVVAPIEGSPAWKVGIRPGDLIIKIAGESTKGMSSDEAVSRMRGKKGSDVTIAIFRKGFDAVKEVKITRDVIKIRGVRSEELETGYGYIRLNAFNEDAATDVKAALDQLEKKNKIRGVVLDLRSNPGGLLDQAVDVASLFISQGVIVSTVGRNRDQKEVRHARRGMARAGFPMVVLVDPNTASAAEIVAGAIQDHKRGVVMGQSTFGKGSVQTVIDLGKDLGLKLTIARYYTPNGVSIQESGVKPDILLEQYDPQLLDKAKIAMAAQREKDLPGHLAGENKKEREGFSRDELEELVGSRTKSESGGASTGNDNAMTPLRFEVKGDYQVREAFNYLKSYEIFKELGTPKADSAAAVDMSPVFTF